jgi:hypothetical protein
VRLVRTVAHARASAPRHAVLYADELRKLRELPAWQRWLYLELVQLSDFETGRGRSSWSQLGALLDWDHMPGRPPAGAAVSTDQVRRAVQALEAAGLVTRDGFANRQTGALFFAVAPRNRRGVAGDAFARGSAKGPAGPDASTGAGSADPAGGVSPGVSPGVTEPIPNTARELAVDNLSTAPPGARERLRAARDRIAGGSQQAPPGAQSVAP